MSKNLPKASADSPEYRREVLAALKANLDFLQKIDATIDDISVVLKYAQPPYDGSIGIRWVRLNALSMHYPRVGEWHELSRKKATWRFKELKRERLAMHAKYNGDFLEHVELVRDTLSNLQTLLAIRAKMTAAIRTFLKDTAVLTKFYKPKVNDIAIRTMEYNMQLREEREKRERQIQQRAEKKKKDEAAKQKVDYVDRIIESDGSGVV